jgi:phosphate transport system substrate-binding protein
MTERRIVPRLGLIAAILFGAGNAAASDTIRVGGVGAATALLPHVFAAFDPSEKFKLEVIPGLGTTGGLNALAENVLDMAVSGRALKPDELARGLTQRVAIRTPFVLVTSHSRPNDLKGSEIAGIFKNAKATWGDGSPVRIILRPKSDSDTAVLGAIFPDMANAIEQARLRQDLPLAATDQDNADLAERIPGSLTGSTLTQVKMEQRRLRLVRIDGVEPSLENLERGIYPFAKTLHFVLPAKNNPVVERFVEFLLTPAGQAALKASGNLLVN